MKRLYYVGTEIDYVDIRLPGMVLNFGNAVDVHSDVLADELLALPQFNITIVSPRAVFRAEVVEEEPEPEPDEKDDLEVDHDDT